MPSPNSSELDPLKLGLITYQDKHSVTHLGQVTVPDTYDGISSTLHPNGLYSVEIFGLKGSPQRMKLPGYIALNTPIIIPDIYIQLQKARELYVEIMRGTTYAIFDTKVKDFIETPSIDGGKTGYTFFMKHLAELVPSDTGSSSRSRLIALLNKFKGNITTSYWLVIPAGYRDIEQTPSGRTESDDINSLYIRILNLANLIQGSDVSYDSFRFRLQEATVNLSKYIDLILYGKHGMINSKFAKRGIRGGVRSVLTSQIHDVADLDDPANLQMTDATIGINQYMTMYADKLVYTISKLLVNIIPEVGYDFTVIDPTTHQAVQVPFDPDVHEILTTAAGYEKLRKLVTIKPNRVRPLTMLFNGKTMWVGALYKPPGSVSIIADPATLPNYDPQYLHPITVVELVCIAIAELADRAVATCTRPPVLGKGGISPYNIVAHFTDPYEVRHTDTGIATRYPVITYTRGSNDKTTTHATPPPSHLRGNTLMANGTVEQPGNNSSIAVPGQDTSVSGQSTHSLAASPYYGLQTPHLKGTWVESLTVPESHIAPLAGDFDGDMLSSLPIKTEEAIDEVKSSFDKADHYLDTNGKLLYGLSTVGVMNMIHQTLTS